jgi:hypothetical protein
LNKKIVTEINPFIGFTQAEDYHQKFRLQKHRNLLNEFRAKYPDTKDFIASTAVARINGYLGGYGTPEGLMKELDDLGLSTQGEKTLIDILSVSRPEFRSCPL